jgi:transposase
MKTEKTKAIAADKAGMDRKTAHKYEKACALPSVMKQPHQWRTRTDPYEAVWDQVKDLLATNPGLDATTIFDYLQREHKESFKPGQLRTLQRRIRSWRAQEGPAKEVFFPQTHHPGDLSESDFTNMNELGITIRSFPFDHILYHFVLTYSNWEAGTICFSESFESLSQGFQNAAWRLGGVSKRHRTDRMSSAVHKECNPEKFTRRYAALLRHYAVEPERTNPASANENGDVEQRNYRFKKAVKQALMLRGGSDFESREDYEAFLDEIFERLNAPRKEKLSEEVQLLGNLPSRRIEDYKVIEAIVTPSSTIHIQHNTYSVHSRLIGERVEIRIFVDNLEIWYAHKLVERLPRLRGESKHAVNYRHVIEWLVRKPGAFKDYRYRSDMFPSSYFRMAYDNLRQHNALHADKEYLRILHIAALSGERVTEAALRALLSKENAIMAEAVRALVDNQDRLPIVTDVVIDNVSLADYDTLLCAKLEAVANG